MPVGCYRFLRASATPRGGATIALPFHGIFMVWHGLYCRFTTFHGLRWIVAPFHGISMVWHGLYCRFTAFHGLRWVEVPFHGIFMVWGGLRWAVGMISVDTDIQAIESMHERIRRIHPSVA